MLNHLQIYHPLKLSGIALYSLLSRNIDNSLSLVHDVGGIKVDCSGFLLLIHPDRKPTNFNWIDVCNKARHFKGQIIVLSYFDRKIKLPKGAVYLDNNPKLETLTEILNQNDLFKKRTEDSMESLLMLYYSKFTHRLIMLRKIPFLHWKREKLKNK